MKNGSAKTTAKTRAKATSHSTTKRAGTKTHATTAHMIRYLAITIESNDDGYLARCPGIQGAFAEGDTIEDAIFNCVDVVKMISNYRKTRGESLGLDEFKLLPEMRVSIALPVGVG